MSFQELVVDIQESVQTFISNHVVFVFLIRLSYLLFLSFCSLTPLSTNMPQSSMWLYLYSMCSFASSVGCAFCCFVSISCCVFWCGCRFSDAYKASSHMLQLMCKDCSYTYLPLSIARYSFIQLSELEQCRVKTLAKSFNTAAQDSNPGPLNRESGGLPLSHCALWQ